MEFGMEYFTQGKPPPANLMVISGNPHVLSGLVEKFREQGYNILVAHPHGHLDAAATYVWELSKLFSGEPAKPCQREMIWPTSPPPSATARGTFITWDLHTCPLPEDKKGEWCNMISNMRSAVDKSLNCPNTCIQIQAFGDYFGTDASFAHNTGGLIQFLHMSRCNPSESIASNIFYGWETLFSKVCHPENIMVITGNKFLLSSFEKLATQKNNTIKILVAHPDLDEGDSTNPYAYLVPSATSMWNLTSLLSGGDPPLSNTSTLTCKEG